MLNTQFNLTICLKTAESLLYKNTELELEPWEQDIIKYRFWHKMTEEQIIDHSHLLKPHYKIGHLLRNKAPELTKRLSEELNELVTRDIFREPLRRQWQRDTEANLTVIERFINFVVYAEDSIVFKDIEVEILRSSLEKKSYGVMSNHIERSCVSDLCTSIWKCQCKYGEDYIGDIASELWIKVSEIMGVKVNKKSCMKVFLEWQEKS